MTMYIRNDGGRKAAGFKGNRDCGIRAVAIACEIPYKEAQRLLREYSRKGRLGSGAIARGIYKEDMSAALASLGWSWRPAPKLEGRKARYGDLPPQGRYIARMARHYAAVLDGDLHDDWNSSSKMVYGYWAKD